MYSLLLRSLQRAKIAVEIGSRIVPTLENIPGSAGEISTNKRLRDNGRYNKLGRR